jgi:hypothetical protein
MRRICIVVAAVLACQAGVARAQKPEATPAKAAAAGKAEPWTTSLGDLKPTAEMWFYEQALRQYQDPKAAVRRAAEFRADQREQRLAAMHWYGLSNQRPRASSDPFHGDYSPAWASSNIYYPYRWSGGPVMALRLGSGESLR